MKPLTHSQNQILAYLMSVGGNENAGSTVKEIISATGVSPNTVYTHLRNGLPGVVKCKHRNASNAEMFYVTTHTIIDAHAPAKSQSPSSPAVGVFQSSEWAALVSDTKIAEGIQTTLNKEPTDERMLALGAVINQNINEALAKPTNKSFWQAVAIASQVLAVHALNRTKEN